MPYLFDVEQTAKKHPLKFKKSLNTVLQQVILSFDRLRKLVRDLLKSWNQPIKGKVVIDPDWNRLQLHCSIIWSLRCWTKRSYPSFKPLASYVVDFALRHKFIQDWIDNSSKQTVRRKKPLLLSAQKQLSKKTRNWEFPGKQMSLSVGLSSTTLTIMGSILNLLQKLQPRSM